MQKYIFFSAKSFKTFTIPFYFDICSQPLFYFQKKNLKEVKEEANEDDKVKLKKKRKGNVKTHSDSTVETNVNTNEKKSKEKLKKQRKKERKKLVVSKAKVLDLVEEYEAEVEQDKKRDNLLKQKHQKRKHSDKGLYIFFKNFVSFKHTLDKNKNI